MGTMYFIMRFDSLFSLLAYSWISLARLMVMLRSSNASSTLIPWAREKYIRFFRVLAQEVFMDKANSLSSLVMLRSEPALPSPLDRFIRIFFESGASSMVAAVLSMASLML